MQKNLHSSLYLVLTIMLAANNMSEKSEVSYNPRRQDCIDTLNTAVHNATSFFVKVHAAEALIANDIPSNIEASFTAMRNGDKANYIGSTRVLARYYRRYNPGKFDAEIQSLLKEYLHNDSAHPRLVALESLGKLEYYSNKDEISRDAKQGENGFKAMARWVLSNDGKLASEASLAELLQSEKVEDFRGAAYAIRFKQQVRKETIQALENCVGRIQLKDLPAIYVLSALFVHSSAPKKLEIKKKLMAQLTGMVAARYEICEALSLNGDSSDLKLLEKLLNDEDNDVRVAAANAILKIESRNSK